jgi:hypothetical protein
VSEGDVTLQMLRDRDTEAIKRAITAAGHETFFLDRWAQLRRRLVELAPRIRSVNIQQLLAGYDRLIRLHLGSRGYK